MYLYSPLLRAVFLLVYRTYCFQYNGVPYAKKDVMKRSRANSAITQGICSAFLYIKDDLSATMLYDYGGGD